MLFLVKCITTILSVNVSISSMLLWLTWIYKFLKCCISQPTHCLHSLLPPVKSNPHGFRFRDHNCQLPVSTTISDASLLIYAVFIDLKWILIVSFVRFRDCQLVFFICMIWCLLYFVLLLYSLLLTLLHTR